MFYYCYRNMNKIYFKNPFSVLVRNINFKTNC